MTSRFFFTLSFLLGILNLTAQNLHIDEVDRFVTLIEDNNRSIGSLTIHKDGKQLYNRNFGQSNIPQQRHDQDTKYQIGSITKIYTAVLIFQLVEKGNLSLDDRLERFFPDMPGAKEITIAQMLNHTSGLGDYTWKEDDSNWLLKKVTEQQILDEIKHQGLVLKPGERQEYSNSAYYLLAKITEKLFRKDYPILIQEKICKPLGLKNTTSMAAKSANVYRSYNYDADGKWMEVEDFYFPNTKGVGDIVATTADMLTFINALFHYNILKKETVAIMKPIIAEKEYFGRGLMQIPMRTQLLYGHGGDTKGTHSVLGYNEKDGVSIALVINGERYTRNQFLLGLLSIMYEEPFDLPTFKTIEVSVAEMDTYTGTYSSPQLPIKIMIFHDKGVLYAQGTGQPALPLEPYDVKKFQFEEAGVQIEFQPEKNIMIFQQGGMVIETKKE